MMQRLSNLSYRDELDYTIDRQSGMKGYIINITSKGEGTIFSDEHEFHVKAGDILLSPHSTDPIQ